MSIIKFNSGKDYKKMDYQTEAEKIYNEMKDLVSEDQEDRKAGKAISPRAFKRIQRDYDWFLRKQSKNNLDSLKHTARELRIRMYMDANGVGMDTAERERLNNVLHSIR
jgi:hypothetical protein